MDRQQKLIHLCNKSKNITLKDLGWCFQLKKGTGNFNTFNIPKYMLYEDSTIEITHENYKIKTSRRKGAKTPVHIQDKTFKNVDELFDYVKNHKCAWDRVVKKSRKGD